MTAIAKLAIPSLVAASLAGPALADPAVLSAAPSGWTNDLTVYLFAPVSTSGTSTVAGVEGDVDMSLKDALEVLDFTISGRFEAWNGNWGLLIDANYLGISDEQTTATPGPGSGEVSAEVDVTQHWFGLLGGYRISHGRMANGQPYSVDLQGGLRYNELKQTVKLTGPGSGRKFGGTETWWEPVIGARTVWGINDRWNGAAMFDMGGFGAGGNDLAISATLGVDYVLSDSASLKLGWRYYSIDFSESRSDGKFAYDMVQTGPVIGLSVSF